MRRLTIPIVLAPALFVGCAAHHKPTRGTLADLQSIKPDVQEAKVDQGLDQAMQSYRRFLEETPETSMTPEAMRRLADLQIEKQFGIHTGELKPREMAAPKAAQVPASASANPPNATAVPAGNKLAESDKEFERRTTAASSALPSAEVDNSLLETLGGHQLAAISRSSGLDRPSAARRRP